MVDRGGSAAARVVGQAGTGLVQGEISLPRLVFPLMSEIAEARLSLLACSRSLRYGFSHHGRGRDRRCADGCSLVSRFGSKSLGGKTTNARRGTRRSSTQVSQRSVRLLPRRFRRTWLTSCSTDDVASETTLVGNRRQPARLALRRTRRQVAADRQVPSRSNGSLLP
jgi:hypothetical protein